MSCLILSQISENLLTVLNAGPNVGYQDLRIRETILNLHRNETKR